MSLVAYGSGSSSESEDESSASQVQQNEEHLDAKQNVLCLKADIPAATSSIQDDSINDLILSNKDTASPFRDLIKPKSSSLFDSLPKPKSKTKVQITVPPLAHKEKDVAEPVAKKLRTEPKGSGLFSLLPAPKNMFVKEAKRSFVPYVLTKKPTVATPHKPPHIIKKSNLLVDVSSQPESGDDSGEESEKPDFFSLNPEIDSSPETVEDIYDLPSTSQDSTPNSIESDIVPNDEPLAFVAGFQPSPWAGGQPQPGSHWQHSSNTEQSTSQDAEGNVDYLSVVEDDLQLDDETLQRLCGRRAKKQPMEFIDVKGAEIMPDPKEWLLKQLSQEQPKMRSHKKHDGPTTQQRRKHQITYLAFQAKANELELKNQWSQNRISRKQTQSKYGF